MLTQRDKPDSPIPPLTLLASMTSVHSSNLQRQAVRATSQLHNLVGSDLFGVAPGWFRICIAPVAPPHRTRSFFCLSLDYRTSIVYLIVIENTFSRSTHAKESFFKISGRWTWGSTSLPSSQMPLHWATSAISEYKKKFFVHSAHINVKFSWNCFFHVPFNKFECSFVVLAVAVLYIL